MNLIQDIIDSTEVMIRENPRNPGKPMGSESAQALRDFAAGLRLQAHFDHESLQEELTNTPKESMIDPRELTALSPEVHQLPASIYTPEEVWSGENQNLALFNQLQQAIFAEPGSRDIRNFSAQQLAAHLQRAHPELYSELSNDDQIHVDSVANSLAKRLGRLRTQGLLPPERQHELRSSKVYQPRDRVYLTFYAFRRPGMVTTTGSAPAVVAASEKEVCQASPQ